MAEPRAAAERQVEDALAALRACQDPPEGEVLTDWVLVAARRSFDAGNPGTSVAFYVPTDAPTYQSIGLLRTALVMAESDFLAQPGDAT